MGRLLVEVVGCDEQTYGFRNQIANRDPACNPLADLRGRDIDPARQDGKITRSLRILDAAPEDHELDQPEEIVDPAPRVQFTRVVGPDQIVKMRFRMPRVELLHAIDGKTGSGPAKFGVVQAETRFPGDGGRHHGATQFGGSGRPRQFMGRNGCGQKYDPVETQFLDRIPRQDQVAVMNGIERAAVQSEAKWGRSGLRLRVAEFQVSGFGLQISGFGLHALHFIRHSAFRRQPHPQVLVRVKIRRNISTPPSQKVCLVQPVLGELFPDGLLPDQPLPGSRRVSDLCFELHGASAGFFDSDSRRTAEPGEGEPEVIWELCRTAR